jgi:excisionase family DNA binding protein
MSAPIDDSAPVTRDAVRVPNGNPAPTTVIEKSADPQPRSPFLTVEEVAERQRCSTRTVREQTRLRQIPHLKNPGGLRCLFRTDWLEAWELGAELEVLNLPRGGRVVRPAEGGR